MKPPYRPTRFGRIARELKWDMVAWLIGLAVLAWLLWPAWQESAPRWNGEAPAATPEDPAEPDEQARPPPARRRVEG